MILNVYLAEQNTLELSVISMWHYFWSNFIYSSYPRYLTPVKSFQISKKRTQTSNFIFIVRDLSFWVASKYKDICIRTWKILPRFLASFSEHNCSAYVFMYWSIKRICSIRSEIKRQRKKWLWRRQTADWNVKLHRLMILKVNLASKTNWNFRYYFWSNFILLLHAEYLTPSYKIILDFK